MAKISRRKMMVSGGAVALGASATAVVGEAFTAQPKMTSREYTEDEIKAIGEPLHAQLRIAMEKAGLSGEVVAGFQPEGIYLWARHSVYAKFDGEWDERHFLARMNMSDYPRASEEFVAWFTAQCVAGRFVYRGVNGTIPAIQWHPDV